MQQEKRMTQTALPLTLLTIHCLFFVLTDFNRGGYGSSQGQGYVQDSFGNEGTAPKVRNSFRQRHSEGQNALVKKREIHSLQEG